MTFRESSHLKNDSSVVEMKYMLQSIGSLASFYIEITIKNMYKCTMYCIYKNNILLMIITKL